ncbi:sn-glycerol-3-phosphate ABC transporter ATP-binding protein UgpC [Pelomonas sp. CA6]|uniref:ABC transporter ATP-binding protein n=1 Tax=Pelomonas sp. CA6 TaxID=2907999 RepID=UPI001F4AABDA|nr:sn-glycerol-3-phosphate ABC transporter ATP-binding protein UgpC [Pelomonas sp. CA6]MCH7342881.1 sn-glycerol-3-phosphate ABC transporter ATP-binding protein UgpC [Pelomonas sp. CA6]
MASLSLRGLRKHYGSTPVLHGIDLDVAHGEFVVFVGPSGCGKSTLLRCIAGLESISEGELRIDDRRMNEVDPAARGLAMVFQSYALYPHMTVAQNMSFGLKLAGTPRAEVERAVAEAAEALQLTPLLQRLPAQLSGGQRQRVAIGRAIVRRPGIFLFDEPLSNLDAALRGQMRVEMARLHAQLGSTVLYVTHDQAEAMTLADRIVVFNKGRIEQVGAPLTLYRQPANRFVAEFLGSPRINLLPSRQALPGAASHELGLRPEQLRLRPSAEGGRLAGELQLLEHLGDVAYAHVRTDDGALLVARAPADTPLRGGERVALDFDPEQALHFDAQGRRLEP